MRMLTTCKRQLNPDEIEPRFPARRQVGATLIEVMIAVLVLAVGILGLMTLQINGKKATYQALQRGAATTLAADMLTRMRINPNTSAEPALLINEYDTGALLASGVGGAQLAAPGVDCAVAGGCTAVELAAYDLFTWEQRLDDAVTSSGLVNPTGCITVDDNFVQVVVAWESAVPLDQTRLLATMAVDCGIGKYVDGGADDVLRQAVVMSTFVATR